MQNNMETAAQRHFGPSPIEKTIPDWQAIKDELEKNYDFQGF